MNIKAVPDAEGKFIYFAIAYTWSMHDSTACTKTMLKEIVDIFPQRNFIVGDSAYTPSKHLFPVYGGTKSQHAGKNITNFFILQCGIHIKRAFGISQKQFLQKLLGSKPSSLLSYHSRPLKLLRITLLDLFSLR